MSISIVGGAKSVGLDHQRLRLLVERSDKASTRLAISLLKKSYLVIYRISKENGASWSSMMVCNRLFS
jgi:hypothetical protein